MRKLLNKPWFAVLLAAAALLVVGRTLQSGLRGPVYGETAAASPAAATSTEPGTAAVSAAHLPAAQALRALTIPKVLRDPFAPRVRTIDPAVAAAKVVRPDVVETVHLSALWTQSGTTFVVLNGRVCQPGEEIGRIKIESATQDGVWVTHWKGRDFIALGGEFTLSTPADGPATVVSTL